MCWSPAALVSALIQLKLALTFICDAYYGRTQNNWSIHAVGTTHIRYFQSTCTMRTHKKTDQYLNIHLFMFCHEIC